MSVKSYEKTLRAALEERGWKVFPDRGWWGGGIYGGGECRYRFNCSGPLRKHGCYVSAVQFHVLPVGLYAVLRAVARHCVEVLGLGPAAEGPALVSPWEMDGYGVNLARVVEDAGLPRRPRWFARGGNRWSDFGGGYLKLGVEKDAVSSFVPALADAVTAMAESALMRARDVPTLCTESRQAADLILGGYRPSGEPLPVGEQPMVTYKSVMKHGGFFEALARYANGDLRRWRDHDLEYWQALFDTRGAPFSFEDKRISLYAGDRGNVSLRWGDFLSLLDDWIENDSGPPRGISIPEFVSE